MRKSLAGAALIIYFVIARVGAMVAEIAILVEVFRSYGLGWAAVFFFIGSPFVWTVAHWVGLVVAIPFMALGGAHKSREGVGLMGTRRTKNLSRAPMLLAELQQCVLPGEKPMGVAQVGHMGGLAFILVTDQRILWRLVQPGAPVLSLNFDDIWRVRIDQGLGVLLTYRPADFPDVVRAHNPDGEVDAEFIFLPGDEDVRQFVLDRAAGVCQLRTAGAVLARGEGYLEGFLESENYGVEVGAHESRLVIFMGGSAVDSYPYSAVNWFRVESLPEGRRASEQLGVGQQVVWMSLNAEGAEDRWRLAVKPDDLIRWRVILEYFGVRDAARTT